MSNPTGTLREISQAQASRNYLSKVFAQRLTLTQVAQSMIQEWITDTFAGSSLQADNSWIGVIQRTKTGSVAYGQLTTLSDALIARCMSATLLNYTSGHHQLLRQLPAEGFQPVGAAISVEDVERMLNALAPQLLEGFCVRLVAYWNARIEGQASHSRWEAVSKQLRACLLTARQNPPLSLQERKMLLGEGSDVQVLWAYQEDRQALGAPNPLRIYQVYAAQAGLPGEWLPLLVLQRQLNEGLVSLVYLPVMALLKLDTLDQLGSLLPRYMSTYTPGLPLSWVLKEPHTDVFDALAQSLLERQLRSVRRIDWSVLATVGSYERLLIKLTSPLAWFNPDYVQQPHEEQLPIWLQTAGGADRQAYGQWLARLAHLQQCTAGASFLDGLEPIDVYARKALQRQMRLDHPQEVIINPDDYLLTFERTQGGTVGWTQRATRTLTEWALENPFASAYARVQISNQAQPGYVPDWWIKPDYLKQLIETVDVGKHYPALLNRLLLSDPVESARRRRLFVDQMAIQLPLHALENSLRQRNGFTQSGVSVVQAILQDEGRLDTQVIVARPLAFLTHAGGVAHKARNLFVIGPRDNSDLPHILYRPDQHEAMLQQFASRQALLDEVARMGSDLQAVVLERMSENDQAVFARGGFLHPHVQRFLQGDEYSTLPVSGAALLSDEQVPGVFLEAVFDESATSLWQLAKKQAVSNEALRWSLFKNDLWQVFNVLLPMLRGPVAVAGWLSQMFDSFRTLLALPPGASQEDSASALIELIGSSAGLLLSHVVPLDERLRLRETWPITGGRGGRVAFTGGPHIHQPVAAFAWQRSMADITAMDFSWATSRLRPNSTQRAQLETFQWAPGPGETWPANPTVISTDSPIRGRVVVHGNHQDYTLIDSKLYGVKPVGGRWRIVDLSHNERSGPWLRQDSKGVWKVDLGLQLLGGQPKKVTAAERRIRIQNENLRLERDYSGATARLDEVLERVRAAQKRYREVHASDSDAFTDQQRHDSSTDYLRVLEEEYRLQLDRINALTAKNTHKPVSGFEREKMKQLEAIVENLRDQMTVVINTRAGVILSDERLSELEAQMDGGDEAIAQAAHRIVVQSALTIAEYNAQLIDLSTLEQNAHERLMGVPGYEPHALLMAAPETGTPLDWKSMQLKALYGAMLRRLPSSGEYEDFDQLHELFGEAIQSIQSQKTLREPDLLSMEQRITGYEAIAREYRRSQAGIREYGDMAVELVDKRVIEQLGHLLKELGREAEQSLSMLLREQEARPAAQPVSVPSADKRLFLDRKKRYQLGQVRARTPESEDEIVDILSPIDKSVQASFRRSPSSDDFEPVTEAAASVSRPVRSLEKLKGDARRLLDREPLVVEQARNETHISSMPDSVEARLARQAEAMKGVAQKIRKALVREPEKDKGTSAVVSIPLLDELAQASSRLVEQGRLIRIEMVKHLPPDEEGIAYLKQQNEVEIVLVKDRVQLKRLDDFLQEYVIKDRQGKVLAYAHFHYRARTTPNAGYSAGHLKRPEQRFMSYRSLGEKTDADVIAIYYSRISPAMAQRLFFSTRGVMVQRGRRVFW